MAEWHEVLVEESFVPFLQLRCCDHHETYFQQDAAGPPAVSTVADGPKHSFS